MKIVTREQIEQLADTVVAAPAAPPASAPGSNGAGSNALGPFIPDFLARHPEIEIASSSQYRGGTRYILKACPFDASHNGTSVAIFEGADGKLGFKCQHNSCADNHWTEYRAKYEVAGVRAATGNTTSSIAELRVMTISEGMAEIRARGQRIAHWGDVIVAGELILLAGLSLAGKSTLAYALSKHLGDGQPFLGLPCRQSRVLYLALERNSRRQIFISFTRWKVNEKQVYVIGELPLQTSVINLCLALEQRIKEYRAEVVIIDNLQSFTQIVKGNEYGTVSTTIEPLSRLARDNNVAIMGMGHQRRAGYEQDDIDVVGSVAYRAAADVMIGCRKTGGRADPKFFVSADVRIGTGFDKLQINIDPDTGLATFVAAWEAEINAAKEKVVGFLRAVGKPMTQDEIRQAVGLRRDTVLAVIKDNVDIKASGTGLKKDPLRYAYVPDLKISDEDRAAALAAVEAQRPPRPDQLNSNPGRARGMSLEQARRLGRVKPVIRNNKPDSE